MKVIDKLSNSFGRIGGIGLFDNHLQIAWWNNSEWSKQLKSRIFNLRAYKLQIFITW